MNVDPHALTGVLMTAAAAVIATTFGLLPARIDLTFVFAAYGGGTIIGEVLATRLTRPPRALPIRWGVLTGGIAAAYLGVGLIAGVLS